MEIMQPQQNGAGPELISDSDTSGFQADVLDASANTPVLVDFWAPWCGPCRQLTPTLEKVTREAGGKIRLVKINIDENQALAGQMGIQSIPAVFAFVDGRPVDGFLGALPESEVKRFIERLPAAGGGGNGGQPAGNGPEEQIKIALEQASEAEESGQPQVAGQIYSQILGVAPTNAPSLIGLARLQLQAGNADAAKELLDRVAEEDRETEGYEAVKSALALAEEAAGLDDPAALLETLAANPDDHQARFDLALALNARTDRLAAAAELIEIIRRDREWEEQKARKKLLELFEAWGPADPATLKGRRQLSSLLFS